MPTAPGTTQYLPNGGGDLDDQPEVLPTFSAIIEGNRVPVVPIKKIVPGDPVLCRLEDGEEVMVPWLNFARD